MVLSLLQLVRNSWQIITPLGSLQWVQDVSDCELASCVSENLNNSPPSPFFKTFFFYPLFNPQSNTRIDNIFRWCEAAVWGPGNLTFKHLKKSTENYKNLPINCPHWLTF